MAGWKGLWNGNQRTLVLVPPPHLTSDELGQVTFARPLSYLCDRPDCPRFSNLISAWRSDLALVFFPSVFTYSMLEYGFVGRERGDLSGLE